MADKDAVEGEEKKKSKLPLIIGLVVVLGGGGAGAWFSGLLGGGGDEKEEVKEVDVSELPAQYVYMKPEFISNFIIDGRSRYMKIEVVAMTRDDDVVLAMETHMPTVRNQLVMLFGNTDYDSLKTHEGKLALQQAALTEVQTVMKKELGKEGVEKILLMDFVLQ
ncbi:MAG: flagellar basal body-associated FliL family protein [Pseudomonadales bacterium]